MDFSLPRSLEILESTPDVLLAMLTPLDTDWTSCNEGGDSWTAAEVVAHLVVCEKSVWLPRTKVILEGNDKTLGLVDMDAQNELAKDTTRKPFGNFQAVTKLQRKAPAHAEPDRG